MLTLRVFADKLRNLRYLLVPAKVLEEVFWYASARNSHARAHGATRAGRAGPKQCLHGGREGGGEEVAAIHGSRGGVR
jgi:hypothetical protein